jgi:hypothetical protein
MIESLGSIYLIKLNHEDHTKNTKKKFIFMTVYFLHEHRVLGGDPPYKAVECGIVGVLSEQGGRNA